MELNMSKLQSKNYAEAFSAAHRHNVLVEILSEAVCRLAEISTGSPKLPKILSESANSSLTSLDVSEKKRLHVTDGNHLESEEL
jgi:hypothetical protein